jgi:hypothetical protein
MKNLILAIFLSTLFSCNTKTVANSKQVMTTDTIVGSTLDNINNSEFSLIQFHVDDKLGFATINQYFRNYKSKSSFPFSLWVTVETLEKNGQGHPLDTEATLFNSLEDSLIDHFVTKTPFCYIGRTTRDGYRELMFYISDKDKAKEVMNEFIKTNTFKRKIEFAIDQDAKWESVEGFYQ